MLTAHPKNNALMRRTSRIYLTEANPGKVAALRAFLLLYANVVNYFIAFFWSGKNFTAALADKFITGRAVKRFGITARLAQCAAKQAKETVRSQRERQRKTMPCLRRKVATLDSRFVTVTPFRGGAFDLALRFASGLPKLVIPLHWTAHTNRLREQGWQWCTTIRLGLDGERVWVELIFEKERPALRTEGTVLGIDRGLNKAFTCSDGQVVGGADFKAEIAARGKRDKTAHHHSKTELFRRLKQLKLEGVKTIVLEDLRYLKRGKRGKFPRRLNRLLSFWLTARAVQWLECRCEELGIRLIFVSPYKTSQRCSHCGKTDKVSRRGERFKCVGCGYETDADYNASLNLELLGLAGVNSLRLLPTS